MGPGCEFETLRNALAAAGPYDRVVLHPGVYEEQAEVVMKVPVELVGLGLLGEVALLVCIEQQCPTARLCNLVFMPPWFSTVVYKVKNKRKNKSFIENINIPVTPVLSTFFKKCPSKIL